MMANMQECIDTLRRRIGDTEEPFTFADDLLTGYIGDAVDQVELDFNRGVVVSFGFFDTDITPIDVALFCIKAHYLMTLRAKDKAGRDNFRMVKGRLTLDNTGQAKDHKDTLELIDKEYIKALVRAKNGGKSIEGLRLE
jgi:hypothetical protein